MQQHKTMIRRIVIDGWCLGRQFGREATGSAIHFDPEEFEKRVNRELEERGGLEKCLVDGYAPFCKHMFLENFTDAKTGTVEITETNKQMLESAYAARSETELPVLERFFYEDSVHVPRAKYLDLILYSREQLRSEHAATGNENYIDCESPWGIVSIKAQDIDVELPMQPITMMRNALGKEEGGSGVKLDREKYYRSVEFWSKHAVMRSRKRTQDSS